jgi:hypothetical protein
VKSDTHGPARVAANAIVQLGRIARSKKLPCHDMRCALSPVDHARERLDWITSWVWSLDDAEWEDWLWSLSEAYSRLIGNVTTISHEKKDGKVIFQINESENPHHFTVNDNGRVRVIDYSDFNEIKEFKLY